MPADRREDFATYVRDLKKRIETLERNVTTVAGGGEDKTYHHFQSVASTTWTIDHGLNKYPSVEVFDNAGDQVEPWDIDSPTTNQTVLTFSAATAGEAHLN